MNVNRVKKLVKIITESVSESAGPGFTNYEYLAAFTVIVKKLEHATGVQADVDIEFEEQ